MCDSYIQNMVKQFFLENMLHFIVKELENKE